MRSPKYVRPFYDVESLLREAGILFYCHGEDTHAGEGWIQMDCPFCHSEEPHLGFNMEAQAWKCWSCGRKGMQEAIGGLLGLPGRLAMATLGRHAKGAAMPPTTVPVAFRAEACLPPRAGPLHAGHIAYLKRRRYDPARLVELWGICGIGPGAGAWTNRVIIPINIGWRLLSYMGRAIISKAEPPYLTPPLEEVAGNHKDIVYGWDQCAGDGVVIVEGVFDAWRLGPGACATFGTGWTKEQVLLLSQKRRRFVLYDSTAQNEARALAEALSATPGTVELLKLPTGDPDDLPDEEASTLMQTLGVGV